MKVSLCKLEQIPEQSVKTVNFFGRELLILKVNGRPKAFLNFCMHLGGPMKLEGDRFVCMWHGAEFDCHHGKAVKGPARPNARLITLPTRVEDGVLNYIYGE